jgi:phosphate starvation-inducible protein PhoH and related proteins
MALPRNFSQTRYLTLLQSSVPVVIGTGPAGTGKTLLACHAGANALLKGRVSKLVLTRPAVSVDEQHGFLPGTLEKKMEPWTRPMLDCLSKYISPRELKEYVEICPLAYMRGRTFEHSWIIGDEMQNSTPAQMKMLLTRIGEGSKIVITGDMQQHDRGFEENGLSDLTRRVFSVSDYVHHVEFSEEDVVRHPAIREILSMYDINR